jgi:hypothetical protein
VGRWCCKELLGDCIQADWQQSWDPQVGSMLEQHTSVNLLGTDSVCNLPLLAACGGVLEA